MILVIARFYSILATFLFPFLMRLQKGNPSHPNELSLLKIYSLYIFAIFIVKQFHYNIINHSYQFHICIKYKINNEIKINKTVICIVFILEVICL